MKTLAIDNQDYPELARFCRIMNAVVVEDTSFHTGPKKTDTPKPTRRVYAIRRGTRRFSPYFPEVIDLEMELRRNGSAELMDVIDAAEEDATPGE